MDSEDEREQDLKINVAHIQKKKEIKNIYNLIEYINYKKNKITQFRLEIT